MKEIILNSNQTSCRLDKLLVDLLADQDWSRSYIQKLIKQNNVKVNHQIINQNNFLVKPNSEIIINVDDPKPSEIIGEQIDLDIVYQDDDLVVINKKKKKKKQYSSSSIT